MTRRGLPARRRAAFTLIELLVVITIIGIVATIGVVFYPNFASRQNTANGVDRVTGALLISKQRARRDGVSTGVQLIIDPATNTCNQLQYIQQPDDFAVGRYYGLTDPNNLVPANPPYRAFFVLPTGVTLAGSVNIGDSLELYGGGQVRLIVGVGPNYLDLQQPINNVGSATSVNGLPTITDVNFAAGDVNYRVIRQPVPISGEPVITLPDPVVIDLNTNANYANGTLPLTNVPTYVLFLPSGAAINSPGSLPDNMFLWVRDFSVDNTTDITAGYASIVAVSARTGFIAVHPPAAGADPYLYARDGRSSGM
jgi:prepilin-type N-terminal cleavage/methylation domain-containing protein